MQSKKFKSSFLFLVISLFLLTNTVTTISLDLSTSSAILCDEETIKIIFVCSGGTGVYYYTFKGLPSGWKTFKNQIIVNNFSPTQNHKWSIKVQVMDTSGKYLEQTIEISFVGYYVSLTPMSAPQIGIKNVEQIKILQKQWTKKQPHKQKIEKNNILELINTYPGLPDYRIPLQNGNYSMKTELKSTIFQNLLQSNQATYDQNRDGNKITAFDVKRNAIFMRQSNANKAVANLITIIQKLTANLNSAKSNIILITQQLTHIKGAVNNCNLDLYNLKNIKAKITNAIEDKQSKLQSFQNEIGVNNNLLSKQQNILSTLQQSQQQTEQQKLPNSNTLIQLQNGLAECKNFMKKNRKGIDDAQINISISKREIQLTKIQINEGRNMISNLNGQLDQVKSKINRITEQLRIARQEQKSILEDIKGYENIPIQGNQKIEELSAKINELGKFVSNGQTIEKEKNSQCEKLKEGKKQVELQMQNNNEKYEKLKNKINNQQKLIDKVTISISELTKAAGVLPMEIQTLKVELNRKNGQIHKNEYFCQDKEILQLKNQQIYHALKVKYEQSTKQLRQANLNLEKARAEQQLANLAVNQLLVSIADATPFPQSGQFDVYHQLSSIKKNNNKQAINQFSPEISKNENNSKNKNEEISHNNFPFIPISISPSKSKTVHSNSQGGKTLNGNKIDEVKVENEKGETEKSNSAFTIGEFLQKSQKQQQTQKYSVQTEVHNKQFQESVKTQQTKALIHQKSTEIAFNSQKLPKQFNLSQNPSIPIFQIGNAKDFLKNNYNIDISDSSVQHHQIYPLQKPQKDKITVKNIQNQGLSTFNCFSQNSKEKLQINSGIIEEVAVGTLIIRGQDNSKSVLTLGLCTKVVLTSPQIKLSTATKIHFIGKQILQSKSNLYYAYLIVLDS